MCASNACHARRVRALTQRSLPQVTWRYWRLHARDSGVLKFVPMLDANGAHRSEQHPYIDPTGSKPSEMLMVWPHTPAERAAAVVDGVYTLEAQQLHDLQSWCAVLSAPTRAHARL